MKSDSRIERVAALYDIHGNLPALDAALRAVEQAHVSLLVIGGDVVLGPMPVEVLERLAALTIPVRFIRGNCDRLVTEAARDVLSAKLPGSVRAMVEWTAAQLSPAQHAFLTQMPMSVRVEIAGGGAVRFCHATPRSDEEIFTPGTPEEEARAMVAGTAEFVIVCGHTHVQFRRHVAPWEVVNAGSVGMSTGPAEAHWLLIDEAYAWQRTRYDAARAGEAILTTSFPGAQEFIAGHVDHAPTPAETWARLAPRRAEGN